MGKGWHIMCVLVIVAAYLIGSKYPQAGQAAFSKVGL